MIVAEPADASAVVPSRRGGAAAVFLTYQRVLSESRCADRSGRGTAGLQDQTLGDANDIAGWDVFSGKWAK
jgi:hypothetical protein